MDPKTALQAYVLDGGIMMIGLVPAAFLAVAFAIQGLINLRRARICPRGFESSLAALTPAGASRADIVARLTAQGHSMALILARVLEHLDRKPDVDPLEILREEIEEECYSLVQRNNQLNLIYNVSPLMGLLGTVIGMLDSFGKFALSDNPSGRDLNLGISVALITTAWGLAIAIPSYMMLYLFARRIAYFEAILLPQVGKRCLAVLLERLRVGI